MLASLLLGLDHLLELQSLLLTEQLIELSASGLLAILLCHLVGFGLSLHLLQLIDENGL